MLYYIPKLLTEEENNGMIQLSEKDKARIFLFDLNNSSASSPDRFIGVFF